MALVLSHVSLGTRSVQNKALDVLSTANPKGPSTQYLGTWDIGNSNYSADLG